MRYVLVLSALLVFVTPSLRAADLPVSGVFDPEFAAFDDLMQTTMAAYGITAGALALSKDGCIVYMRGFGFRDDAQTEELPNDAMFRIASVTKPITAAAIRHLIGTGALSLDDFVFELGQPEGGILDYAPFPSQGDARLEDITVEHLLLHQGGWDRDLLELDLTFLEVQIATEMAIASPPSRVDTVRWIMGQPLQFTPGTQTVYANISFLLLGLILEQVSGLDYVSYVRDYVFNGEVVDLELGRTFPVDQNPREPYYDHPVLTTNVFDPGGPQVYWPEGGWNHEGLVAHGGLIATTETLLCFLADYTVEGADIGQPNPSPPASPGYLVHGGSLDGTESLALQSSASLGIDYVILFNKHDEPRPTTEVATALGDLILGGSIFFPPSCDPAGPTDVVYVDFGDDTGQKNGTQITPWNFLFEGLEVVEAGGTINVMGDSDVTHSSELLIIDQAVTIAAVNGAVSIGSASRNATRGADRAPGDGFVSRDR